MAWDVAVVGTAGLDEVTTPLGHRAGQLGGSAVYFALAASRHVRVHLCGVIGGDGVAALRAALEGCDVDLEGLEVAPGPSRRWYAVHDFSRWVTAEERSEEGVAASWSRRLGPKALAAPVLFVGSMEPAQQRDALHAAPRRLVGSDSMVVHIASEAAAVAEVARGSDVLFLNRAELSALTGLPEPRWVEAARGLVGGAGRLRCVVVKAGPLGAACVSAAGVVERDAHPVDPVVDPTGAGDALAGGFLGACAAAERDDDGMWERALDAGLRSAADAIADFGTAGLVRAARSGGARGSRSAP